MAQISNLCFKTILVDGINDELNTVTYTKTNLTVYFSLQSIAQCINAMIKQYDTREVFAEEFFKQWDDLNLKCVTEFPLQLLIPINLILEASTETHNRMPISLANIRYLNDEYNKLVETYSNYDEFVYDIFCFAERQNLTSSDNRHYFIHSLAFLSFIPILKLKFIRILYKAFFNIDLLNSNDIDYIAKTLATNRKTIKPEDIANVFQLTVDDLNLNIDISTEHKTSFILKFNRACKIFKSFAFNIMDQQSAYISKNLQIMSQFGLDHRTIQEQFENLPKFKKEKLTHEQTNLLCRDISLAHKDITNLDNNEISVLQSIIKIHIMIQRMTNVPINEDDLNFYRRLLRQKYSIELDDLFSDTNCGSELDNDIVSYKIVGSSSRKLIKNYTIGEIVLEFLNLYKHAQNNINTLWLCRFIELSCDPQYSNIINIMADFVPCFQHFFTNDFNINGINNIVIFMQGMCHPDEQNLETLKNPVELRLKQKSLRNFKRFTLTRYKAYNSNPLLTFIELLLGTHKDNILVNINALSDMERHQLINLVDHTEKSFIDYIYDLAESNEYHDLGGTTRFNLDSIDYDRLVPIVSTNTFNENNTSTSSLQMYNNILNQTTFFHELSNRITYKIPGVVCNIIVK